MGIETQIINGTVNQTINFGEPDIISLSGIIIAVITAIFLWVQIHKQTKVDSARFTIDYIDKILTDNSDIVDILYKRADDQAVQFGSDKSVRVLLNGFEDTIQFVNDGIIKKTHVLTTAKPVLILIKKDSEVQRIIQEAQNKDKTTFELLAKFLDKNLE